MFLIKLSPKSYLSYNYIIHTQKKIMCVCVCLSLSQPSSVYLLIYFWIDRFLAKTLFPRAPHITTKEKNGGRGRRLFRWFFVPSPFSLENLSSVACFVTEGSWFLVNMELI